MATDSATPHPHILRAVLKRFEPISGPLTVEATQPDEPGFSGARVYRCVGAGRAYCLRRWPSGTDRQRVLWIHQVLGHVTAGGVDFVPMPIAAEDGHTVVCHEDALYQLEPWLPGRPRLHESAEPSLLEQAIVATAHWHRCAERSTRPAFDGPRAAFSPILASRLRTLAELLAREDRNMFERVHGATPAFRELALPILEALRTLGPRLLALLHDARDTRVPLQPVIRDLRCQHFLFVDDRLSGLIDYGALSVDSVACDLGRLMGTLPPMRAADRRHWIDRYARLRPLHPSERHLVDLFEASSVLLSGANWIRRFCADREPVDRVPAVVERMRSIVEHLPTLPDLLTGR